VAIMAPIPTTIPLMDSGGQLDWGGGIQLPNTTHHRSGG
jgi:hypothetical protein